MASSLPSLIDNLAAELQKAKFENVNPALSILGERHHDDMQMSKSKKNYEEKFDEDLTQKIKSKYRFCDRDLNKFCLILQKAAYQYEYIDN